LPRLHPQGGARRHKPSAWSFGDKATRPPVQQRRAPQAAKPPPRPPPCTQRRAAGRAASAPGGLPGRLPRRSGRAGELQAEPRPQVSRCRSARCCRPGRRLRPNCRRSWPQAWPARGAAGAPGGAHRTGDAPEHVAHGGAEAVNAVLLSARHITVHVHPEDLPLVARRARRPCSARGARLLAAPGHRARRLPGRVDAGPSTPASPALGAGRRHAGPACRLGRRAGRDRRMRRPAARHAKRRPRRSAGSSYLADLQAYAASRSRWRPWAPGPRDRPGAGSRRRARAGGLGVRDRIRQPARTRCWPRWWASTATAPS
jgi:hypothetical protein